MRKFTAIPGKGIVCGTDSKQRFIVHYVNRDSDKSDEIRVSAEDIEDAKSVAEQKLGKHCRRILYVVPE